MKNNIIIYLYLLLILTSAFSCTLDKDRNLGNGYFLTGYGVNTVIYKKISKKEDKEILLGEIVDYKFDNNFILIFRKVSDDIKEFLNDRSNFEIMRGGDTIQYWIIDKKRNIIIGPLHKDVYLLKCKELRISNDDQLQTIERNDDR